MVIAPSAKIVVVEDHPAHLDYLAALLRRCGYEVDAFLSARAALHHLEQSSADLVITDVFMPGMDGFEVLKDLKRVRPELPIIAVSGSGPQDRSLFLDAMQQLGARAGLSKPLDIHSLLDLVARLTGAPPRLSPSHRTAGSLVS
ncbi:MAG TPA: response regulator [Stellaceae bacterium]|nr:response regulator [Stellaceae bacterium]